VTQIVMFRGEQCWINSTYYITSMLEENPQNLPDVLFELVPIESANVMGWHRKKLVPMGRFWFLPSSIDFSTSEWSIGVSNGKTE